MLNGQIIGNLLVHTARVSLMGGPREGGGGLPLIKKSACPPSHVCPTILTHKC